MGIFLMSSKSALYEEEIKRSMLGIAWNQVIADATVLQQKARHFHWNVLGENFFDLHELFGKIYIDLAEDVDNFAEMVRQIIEFPIYTLEDMLDISDVKECADVSPSYKFMLLDMDLGLSVLSESIKDVVSAATDSNNSPSLFLANTSVSKYKKYQWMIRSFVTKSESIRSESLIDITISGSTPNDIVESITNSYKNLFNGNNRELNR